VDYLIRTLVDAHLNGEVDGFEYLETKMAQTEELCELKMSEAMDLHGALRKARDEFPKALAAAKNGAVEEENELCRTDSGS
jgi:hypothetical protein